jgi:hypothetical protein
LIKESDVPLQLTRFQKLFLSDVTYSRQREHYIGPSFETMACVGINASAVEYVPQPDTSAYITPDSMFMLDAGANYKLISFNKVNKKGWNNRFHTYCTLWFPDRLGKGNLYSFVERDLSD